MAPMPSIKFSINVHYIKICSNIPRSCTYPISILIGLLFAIQDSC